MVFLLDYYTHDPEMIKNNKNLVNNLVQTKINLNLKANCKTITYIKNKYSLFTYKQISHDFKFK